MSMLSRMSNLLREYQDGCGYRKGDLLQPRAGASPMHVDGVIDGTVVVLSQDSLAPHQYYVVGERQSPATPANRFIKFEINGHDWKKV